MHAILVNQAGGAENLAYQAIKDPICPADGVLVANKAIGVNYIDIYLRTGLYKPAGYPYIPGLEGSGEVVAIGAEVAAHFKIGDRIAYTSIPEGAYAELTPVPASRAVKIPTELSHQDAAAVMLQGLTAHYLTQTTFPLQAGQTILIHAAAGGVGLLLIQMAKTLGAHVIGTVSTVEKKNLALRMGADEVFLYTQGKFAAAVREFTGGKGVDVVYDSVGAATFDESLKSLKPRGMLVSFGQSSGSVPPFDVQILSQLGSLSLARPKLFDYIATPAELNQRAAVVFESVATGQLKVLIGEQFPLAAAAEAHQALEGRRTVGKVLLSPA